MLRSLSLDGLLNRYIILGLCNSGVNKETIQKCQSVSGRSSILYLLPYLSDDVYTLQNLSFMLSITQSHNSALTKQ